MCGRFMLGDANWADYHAALALIRSARAPVRYNIKPTEAVALARALPGDGPGGGIEANEARWWFVPEWFAGPGREWKATTFNARIETAHEKPVFRRAWATGRCAIPASGWYEWTGAKGAKRPWFVAPEQNLPLFLFAGLCAARPDGSLTCAILTRPAAPEIAALHPRMPVVLEAGEIAPWLDGSLTGVAATGLGAGWAGRLHAHPVRRFGIADDGPGLIERDGLAL